MRTFQRSRPHLISPRFQCQLGHVTPDHAIPLAVCVFMLSMLVVVAEHMQLATRDHINHVDQCCIYSHHTTFKHAPLMLPSLNKILPAMVLQNEVVKSNIWCLSCSSSHASVHHVSSSPALSIFSDLGKIVVGAVVVLLLLMSGDVEMNPGPFGNKLALDDLACVLEEVLDVSADWYNLGLRLKVKIGTLQCIQTEFSAPKHQLREMLKAWLTTVDDPSWKTLIAALRSRMVGASRLAAALEAKYCQEPQVAAMIRHPPPPLLHTQDTQYSLELKVFDLYYNKLVECISHPERVAFELYSQDLISLKVRDETMKITGPSTYVKASKLVAAVKDQIIANPSVFHKFLSVLHEDPSLVYIADAMADSYRSLLPPKVADTSIPTLGQVKVANTSIPTLSQMAYELRDFENWYLLGLQLNISTDILDSIERTHDTGVRCCIKMVQHWINNSRNPSWDAIHEALKSIGESVIAAMIAAKYNIQPSITSLEHPSSRGEETSESSSTTKARRILSQEQRRHISYFAALLDRITEIVASSVKLDKLLRFLRFYIHPLNPEMPYIDQQILQSTNSVSEVIECLTPDYINYMETGLLEDIIERFECKEAQTLLQQYHDRYPINRLLRDMPVPVSDDRLYQTRLKRLRIESSGDIIAFESARAVDVKRIRTAIESATGIDHQFVTHAQHSKDMADAVMMSNEEAQMIVDQALKSGSVKQRNTIAVVVGIVGSGKTWLIHRLFRISPPARYTSTGVAEKSFRGLMHRIANMDSWKLLSQEDILEFLAPLLKAGLTKADIASLAKTFTEVEAAQSTVSPAKNFTEIDAPQAAPVAVSSPSRSHATLAQPQPEKNYATQAMIDLVQTVEGSEKTFIVEFLHMVDTGGQPEFIEIMPSLIHNSNLTLLVLNLAQSLDEYPPIDFHEDGRAFQRPLPSILTNRQVIHQYARTSQAKRPTHTGTSHPSMFMVIGTHRDRVKGKVTETLAVVNKELKSIFLSAMEDELIVYRSHEEIIFPVNLLEPDDNDKIVLEQIRQKISDAHVVEEAEVPRVPFSFFMFEQNAIKYAEQKQAQDRQVMVLSFDECVQIGTELKMSHEVVQAALIYFHRHNIFLYFQDVLPNLVFLAPQVPLDFVNAIVAFSYKVRSGALPALKAKYVRFCNEGIITEEMLCDHKSLSSCFVPGIYESHHAIMLFRHIYTIAELTNEEPLATSQQPFTGSSRLGQKSSILRNREYLMMSLLADKKDIVDYLPLPSKVAPLVIHFSSGCVPNGCFGNVISCLISKYNWKVCQTEQGKPECLAHNIVTLRDPMLPVTITIVNHIQHLEIHVNMANVEEHFSEICSSIQTATLSALKNVFKVMRFEDIQVEPAFLCPCKCSPSHAATICHFLYGGSYTVCTKTGISIGCLQKEQQFWFQEKKVQQQQPVTLPQLIRFKTRSGSINILERIGTHYWELGVLLLDDTTGADTQAIIEQHHLDATKINLQIFQKWIQGKGKLPVEWSTLVEVLKNIGLVQLANEIEQNLK